MNPEQPSQYQAPGSYLNQPYNNNTLANQQPSKKDKKVHEHSDHSALKGAAGVMGKVLEKGAAVGGQAAQAAVPIASAMIISNAIRSSSMGYANYGPYGRYPVYRPNYWNGYGYGYPYGGYGYSPYAYPMNSFMHF